MLSSERWRPATRSCVSAAERKPPGFRPGGSQRIDDRRGLGGLKSIADAV